MSFSYDSGVPAANNNPSNDQPKMLINTASTDSIIAVDHVSFNASSGGTHKQVTLSSKNTPGAQTDPQSVLYSRSGTASSVADIAFRNQNGIFPVDIIRAAALVTTPTTLTNSFNVDDIDNNSTGVYTVTLTANATTGTSFGVIAMGTYTALAAAGTVIVSYSVTGANTFKLLFNESSAGAAGVNPTAFTFFVFQL